MVKMVNRSVDLIVLIIILMFMVSFIAYNLGRVFAFREIGRAMCNGKNALDGDIYTQVIEEQEVYILRCLTLVAPKTVQFEEVMIGWLPR